MSKLTLDEAIKHCLEVAEQKEHDSITTTGDYELDIAMKEGCIQCAADHRQLAEWLTELKQWRRVYGICPSYEMCIPECREGYNAQIAEYKRLLKAAVEDFSFVSEKFINSMDSSCSMFNHIAGCVKDCPMSSSDDYGRCKWRYTDEALKLMEDKPNGI